MNTVLLLVGIWFLINVLFVVIMIPPRKPRKPAHAGAGMLAPALIDPAAYPLDEEQDQIRLRHVVISIALGVFFSLAPPLMEAVEAVKRRVVGKRLK